MKKKLNPARAGLIPIIIGTKIKIISKLVRMDFKR